MAPPGLVLARNVFASFRTHYEALESWHFRQRTNLLKAKYDRGTQGVFKDLRKQPRDQFDLLQHTWTYGVLAAEGDQLHLDAPIALDGSSHWRYEDAEVAVNEVVVSTDQPCQQGDVLVQHQTLQSNLLAYWRQTWNALEQVDSTVWHRVEQFIQAFVPSLHLQLQPISIPEWRRALRRFKPTAARGVDGMSHLDLVAMPDP